MVESLMLEKMVAFFVRCTRPPIEGPPTQLTAVRSACAFLTTAAAADSSSKWPMNFVFPPPMPIFATRTTTRDPAPWRFVTPSPSYRGSALAASAQLAQQLLPRRWVQSGWRHSHCDMSSSAYARGCSLAYANLRYARRAAWA